MKRQTRMKTHLSPNDKDYDERFKIFGDVTAE
jgi:hypothetical protein